MQVGTHLKAMIPEGHHSAFPERSLNVTEWRSMFPGILYSCKLLWCRPHSTLSLNRTLGSDQHKDKESHESQS